MRALEKVGFTLDRVKGSHYIYFNAQSRRIVTVPFHRKELKKSTLNSVITQSGLAREEFLDLL